jgi:hypothetical protein
MTIKDVAYRINSLASDYEIGKLQQLRKNLRGLRKIYSDNIFSDKSVKIHGEYAYHSGGIDEMQFNIGLESSGYFRYGLAFSLQATRNLSDPIAIFAPKIHRLNHIISERTVNVSDLSMWHYHNDVRSNNSNVKAIESSLIKPNTFIFIGKFFKKQLVELNDKDYQEILETFDRLLPLYNAIEGTDKTKDKIARLCWNDYNWQKPSGRKGKSRNKRTYEYKYGFGHEEWLLDTEKVIDGYHYGSLQPIGANCLLYQGERFNVSLYSINEETKERWWIGTIKNVEVIDEKESQRVYSIYKKSGWLKEMASQLLSVDVDDTQLLQSEQEDFFVLRYRTTDLDLLDFPLRFDKNDPTVKSTYYSTLLNKDIEPNLELSTNKGFVFVAGRKSKTKSTIVHYGEKTSEVDLFHNRMQENVYNQFVNKYGAKKVRMEHPTGIGSSVDLVIKEGNSHVFFEFKTSNSIKSCIREALSQLLEYAYFPNEKRAIKLIIVSQNKATKDAQEYLKKIREQFHIPVYYQRYNPDTNLLENTEC